MLFKNDISKVFSSRARYYNFQFVKADRRHIEVILPVSIFICLGYRHRRVILHQPTSQLPNRTTRDSVMKSYRFLRWHRQPYWILCG